MSNAYDLMADAVADLVADTTLASLCLDAYGENASIFIDQDKNHPADEAHMPSICLHSPSKSAATNRRTRGYGFKVDVAVSDTTMVTTQEDGVEEFSATEVLVDIIDRVVAVVFASLPEGFELSYDFYTDTVTYFPVFVAALDFTFEEPLSIGQDPLAG